MSGPKVVKIVTLEEVTATCEGHLARLDQSIKQWQNSMDKLGETDEMFYEKTIAKRKTFDQMLKVRRFVEIQKLVPMEITTLEDDIAKRRQLIVDVLQYHLLEWLFPSVQVFVFLRNALLLTSDQRFFVLQLSFHKTFHLFHPIYPLSFAIA